MTLVTDRPSVPLGHRRAHALDILETYLPQHSSDGIALACDGVSISFGGIHAVKAVSIEVQAQEFVGLLGPNGAGKSTLFDILNGLKRPDEGRVHLFGRDVTDRPAWDRAHLGMGRTFQANRVDPLETVAENLQAAAYRMVSGSFVSSLLALPMVRAAEERAAEAAYAVATLLDIEDHWADEVGDLDFGRQRRVEIGRTIMTSPRLILLDEPAAGLDAEEAEQLFQLLRRLQQDLGLTVVLVEHYVKAVLRNADRVYVLNQGSLLAAGSPAEIAADPTVREEYLGTLLDVEELAEVDRDVASDAASGDAVSGAVSEVVPDDAVTEDESPRDTDADGDGVDEAWRPGPDPTADMAEPDPPALDEGGERPRRPARRRRKPIVAAPPSPDVDDVSANGGS